VLLQEFTSTEAEAGPSPLAPPCNPTATSVAKVYHVKQVGISTRSVLRVTRDVCLSAYARYRMGYSAIQVLAESCNVCDV
jgi:hypothetical protein